MKKFNKRLEFFVSTSVTFDIKKRLYEIAELEDATVSEVARRFIEQGVNRYKEEKKNG